MTLKLSYAYAITVAGLGMGVHHRSPHAGIILIGHSEQEQRLHQGQRCAATQDSGHGSSVPARKGTIFSIANIYNTLIHCGGHVT